MNSNTQLQLLLLNLTALGIALRHRCPRCFCANYAPFTPGREPLLLLGVMNAARHQLLNPNTYGEACFEIKAASNFMPTGSMKNLASWLCCLSFKQVTNCIFIDRNLLGFFFFYSKQEHVLVLCLKRMRWLLLDCVQRFLYKYYRSTPTEPKLIISMPNSSALFPVIFLAECFHDSRSIVAGEGVSFLHWCGTH